MTADGPNADFIACWTEILVPKFLRFRDVFVRGAKVHSARAIDNTAKEGARVLDVGCGFGETSIEIATRVGPSGRVVGVDCTEAFLDVARKDAAALALGNVRFEVADAQITPFSREFDVVFSRFGTMFFQSPVAAFRNFKKALLPGGQLVFVVWRSIENNNWLAIPKQIAAEILPPPPESGQTCGPGPFSQADCDTVRAMLEAGGFRDAEFEQTDHRMLVGTSLEQAIELQLALGPAGELVREAGEAGERLRPDIEAKLGKRLAEFQDGDGIYMQSSSWTIRATAS